MATVKASAPEPHTSRVSMLGMPSVSRLPLLLDSALRLYVSLRARAVTTDDVFEAPIARVRGSAWALAHEVRAPAHHTPTPMTSVTKQKTGT